MKRKFQTRLKTMLLALTLIFTMTATAFASEGHGDETPVASTTKGNIIVHNADNTDSFKAYKILSAEVDENTNQVKYGFTSDFTEFLGSGSNTTETKTTDAYLKLGIDEAPGISGPMHQILDQFSAYCVANDVDPAYTWTGNTAQEVELGQYVVNGSSPSGCYVYNVMSASFPIYEKDGEYYVKTSVTLNEKCTDPYIDKLITDEDNDGNIDYQVAVGDTVNYEIFAPVPAYPESSADKTYIICDELGIGLTGYNNVKVQGSITDEYSEDGWIDLPDDAYTLTKEEKSDDNPESFKIVFDYDKIKAYKNIRVTYSSVVTRSIFETEGNKNTVSLEYSNTPYVQGAHTTQEWEEKVYSYGIDVTKIDGDDSELGLEGVEFELHKEADCKDEAMKFVKVNDFAYMPATEGDTDIVTKLTTGEDGKLMIGGIDVGTYYLKETKALAGYSIPADPFKIEVVDGDIDGKIDDDVDDDYDYMVNVQITNTKSTATLPETGSTGTIVFIAIGLVGMMAAVVAIAVIRKRAFNN